MPKLKCLDKFIKDNPELHQYLKDKSGVDFDGVYGKDAYVAAIKELQANALTTINDVYAQVGVEGYAKKEAAKPAAAAQKAKTEKPAAQKEYTESEKLQIKADQLTVEANSLPPEQMERKNELQAEAAKLREQSKAAEEAEEKKQEQRTVIHKAAKDAGIDFESKEFMDKSEELTGKRHLDDMSEAELGKVNDYIKSQTEFAPKPKAEGVVPSSLKDVYKDEKGEPVTFYHGTANKNVTELKPSSAQQFGKGVYFGNDKNADAIKDFGDGGKIFEVHLPDKLLDANGREYNEIVNKVEEETDIDPQSDNFPLEKVNDEVKKRGYKGLIMDNEMYGGKEAMVFDPKDIIYKQPQQQTSPVKGVVPSSLKDEGEVLWRVGDINEEGSSFFSPQKDYAKSHMAMEGEPKAYKVKVKKVFDLQNKEDFDKYIKDVGSIEVDDFDGVEQIKTYEDFVKSSAFDHNSYQAEQAEQWAKDNGYDALATYEQGVRNIMKFDKTGVEEVGAEQKSQPQQQTSPIQGEKAEAAAKPKIRVGAEQVQAAQPQKTQPNEKAAASTARQENKGAESSTRPTEKVVPKTEAKLGERYKQIADENDFITPYDRVVKYFADGGTINPSELERIFGGKGDKAARISLMKNNSGTVTEIAHFLWESDPSGKYEDGDYADAIEEALANNPSKSAMQRDIVDRFDWEAAQEKYRQQQGAPEAIPIVEEMSEDDINKLLELDADESKAAELEDFVKQQAQKPKVRVVVGQPAAAEPAPAEQKAPVEAAPAAATEEQVSPEDQRDLEKLREKIAAFQKKNKGKEVPSVSKALFSMREEADRLGYDFDWDTQTLTKEKPNIDVFPPPPNGTTKADNIKTFIPQEKANDIVDSWQDEAKRIGKEEDRSNEVVISMFDFTGSWSQPFIDAGYTVMQFDIQHPEGEYISETLDADDEVIDQQIEDDGGLNIDEYDGKLEEAIKRGDTLIKVGGNILHDTVNPIRHIIKTLESQGKTVKVLISATPCTTFAGSGAQHWPKHDAKDFDEVEKRYGRWAAKHFDSPSEYNNHLVAATAEWIAQTRAEKYAMENPVGRIAKVMNLPAPTLQFHPNAYGDPYTKKTQLWGVFNPNLPQAPVDPVEGSKIQSKLSSKQKIERSTTPTGFAYSFFIANTENNVNRQQVAAQPAQTAPAAPAAETKATPVTKKGEIAFPTALTVSEVKPYAEVEDNYYRPDQQLKFNQGTYEPVRIISHPDVIRAIAIGSRIINRDKQQKVSDQDMKFAADVAKRLGYVSDNGEGSAVALNQAVKEIAKKNRTNTHEVFVVLGEEGKGAAAAAVTPETKPEPPKFHGQVDTAINKLKDLLKPKTNLPPGTQIQGFSLDEILDKAGSIIKTAYDIGANIAEAIEDAIKFVKQAFIDNKLGDVDEDVLRQHFNEQFPQQTKKAQSTKQINEGMINQLGRNSEDALLDGVLHRRAVAADVAVEDTAKQDKLILALMQQDADALIQDFKDIYKEKYLTKVLSIISNINKNNVPIDKIVGIGIALENEIHNIKDGFTENTYGISRPEMNKVFAKIQKLNVENMRTSSKALNIGKTLYNNYYENAAAKDNVLSPDQSAQKDAITGAVVDEQAIDEAAEAHETGVQLTEEAKEQAAEKDTRTPKKVTEKSKVKAKLGDILKDLKDQLNKLDC